MPDPGRQRDYERTDRQRLVLVTIFNKVKILLPVEHALHGGPASRYFKTSLSLTEMIDLAARSWG